MFHAELVEFPKIVFGRKLDFSELLGLSRRLPKVTEDVFSVKLVGFKILTYLTMFDLALR